MVYDLHLGVILKTRADKIQQERSMKREKCRKTNAKEEVPSIL